MNRFVFAQTLIFTLAFLCLSSCTAHRFAEKTDKLIAADALLQKNADIKERYPFSFRGYEFVGFPNVYSPIIFPGASKQSDLHVREGESFLEIGSGTGIFAVMAAKNGAGRVVATDINPDAVANSKENARLHNVADKVTVLQGDMFEPLQDSDEFDVIFFNIPFCHRKKDDVKSMLSKSLYDPEHDLLYRFLRDGKKYIKPTGRLLLGYSTTHGDVALMHHWAQEQGLDVKMLSKDGDEAKDFITVELYEFRKRS